MSIKEKNTSMKSKNILATVVLTLLVVLSARATDVYVYHSGNYSALSTILSAHKITFTTDSVIIITEKNLVRKASFADFDYLRFYQTPIPTAVSSVTDDAVSILFDGRTIHIQSPSRINRVELFSAGGALLQRLSPQDHEVSYSVTELPAGVYLLKTATAGRIIIKKIIKN